MKRLAVATPRAPFTSHPKSQQHGFTLIELSIVLVIISLLVGSVLVGGDMIKAAQNRALVTQIEKYNTAANTFRAKYNGVPGDLANGVAFFSAITNQTAAGLAGAGNGDGLVQSLSAAGTTCAALNCVAGENVLFWYELAQASMIPDSIGTAAANSNYTSVTSGINNTFLPNSKLAGQISVQAASGLNYWVLANISGTAVAGVPPTISAALTPLQAYAIDTKIDDGVPDSGVVTSIAGSVPGTNGNLALTAAVSATTCGTSDTHVYALTTINGFNNANLTVCQLGVRANF